MIKAKNIHQLIFLFLSSYSVNGQINTITKPVQTPCKEYAIYKYNTDLLINVLTYRYDIWHIDDDDKFDIVEFTSNGGAHAFYNLKIWLSSSKTWIEYPDFYSDFPYLNNKKISNKELLNSEHYPQFVVQNFDNDARDEIYLNLNHSFAPIKKTLKKHNLASKKIIIDYKDDKLIVTDFRDKIGY